LIKLFSGILATALPRGRRRVRPRCTAAEAERAAAALRELDTRNDGLRRHKVDGGWGMDEEGPMGRWHGPPDEGDTCPRCGSADVKYVPGFAECAENECGSCGHRSFYLY